MSAPLLRTLLETLMETCPRATTAIEWRDTMAHHRRRTGQMLPCAVTCVEFRSDASTSSTALGAGMTCAHHVRSRTCNARRSRTQRQHLRSPIPRALAPGRQHMLCVHLWPPRLREEYLEARHQPSTSTGAQRRSILRGWGALSTNCASAKGYANRPLKASK